jgi:hypothetical protein
LPNIPDLKFIYYIIYQFTAKKYTNDKWTSDAIKNNIHLLTTMAKKEKNFFNFASSSINNNKFHSNTNNFRNTLQIALNRIEY